MKLLSHPTVICLLLAFSQPPACAQQPEIWDPWLIRAETMTDGLVKDAADLTSGDRALLWARLGAAWFRDDPDRAHTWMRKAVQEVEIVSDGENAQDRRRRLATARSLLSIIALDKQLGSRLLAVLEAQSDSATDRDRRNDANGLVDSALAVIDTDPQLAAKVGSAALRIGLGYRLATLLWQLRKRDSKLSDLLFDQALTVAGATYDREALGWLAVFAFRGETPSDERRARLLGTLAEGLLRLSPAAGNEEKACGLVSIASPLLQQFDRLLPQQAPLVRGALIRCQPNLKPFERQSTDGALSDQALNSVDQLLKAADNAPNKGTRDDLLIRAGQMASQEKQFERAITLLDLVSDDGRKQLDGGWESWRWSYAAEAAVVRLRRGDRSEMQRIIAATMSPLRPFVQISIAEELATKGDRAGAIEYLKEARNGMTLSFAPYRVDGSMSLVRRYAELDPAEALNVLNEAVKAINTEEQPNEDESLFAYARINALSNDLLLQLLKLPVTLFEVDDTGVKDAVAAIKLPVRRAAIRLNLLNASLEQHRAATPATTITAKDKKNVAP